MEFLQNIRSLFTGGEAFKGESIWNRQTPFITKRLLFYSGGIGGETSGVLQSQFEYGPVN